MLPFDQITHLLISVGSDSNLFSSKSNTRSFFKLPRLAGSLCKTGNRESKHLNNYHDTGQTGMKPGLEMRACQEAEGSLEFSSGSLKFLQVAQKCTGRAPN